MTSREAILAAVRAHPIPSLPLPATPEGTSEAQHERVQRFKSALEQVGGTWAECGPESDLRELVHRHYPQTGGAGGIVSTVDELPRSTLELTSATAPSDLVEVSLAIVRGRLGVAENAAVWVNDESLPHRALPFVAEHLVLLLSPSDIVTDMHAAYRTLVGDRALAGDRPGYGVFISGPSKTADIEQSLVVGAQGPRTLLVVFDEVSGPMYKESYLQP